MAENKKSFVLYADLIHTVKKMPKEKAGELFLTILSYVNDEQPVVDDMLVDLVFEPIKRQLGEGIKRSRRGKYHWNWKNGISPKNHSIRTSSDYKYWRKSVFERDGYSCQLCFQVGGKLHAHHIKEFSKHPKLRLEISNGVTLCFICHKLTHKKK